MNWTRRCRQVLLYGSGEEQVEFRYLNGQGGTIRRRHRFEGIIPNLERRYQETESITVREELAKYLSNRPCPECEGTRLNRAARQCLRQRHESSADDAPVGRRSHGAVFRR